MRLSIRTKLAAVLSGLSLLIVLSILLVVQNSFDRGFREYLNDARRLRMEQLVERLSELAADPRSWRELQSNRRYWHQITGPYFANEPNPPAPPPPREPGGWLDERQPPPMAPHQAPPLALLDAQGRILLGRSLENMQTLPINAHGQRVGYLGWRSIRTEDNEVDQLFARRQHRIFLAIAGVVLLVSLLLAWPLSRYLVRPIQQLSAATQRLMRRQYEVSVPVSSNDELGDLAQDFNLMARTLGDHDRSQRQWLADISHELRTPIGVMRSEMEAIQDGVLDLNQAAVTSLLEEVGQLGRLVDDLHQLAVTDLGALRYQIEDIDLSALLQQLLPRLESLFEKARLTFECLLPERPVWIRGDARRLEQLLLNLAQNSIRYTDPDGRVRLRLAAESPAANQVTMEWEDSAPGVEDTDLPHLFERFYRVEKSRQRALGGSGLGLAIVANIVSAHAGTISAGHSSLGGLRLSLGLPLGNRR